MALTVTSAPRFLAFCLVVFVAPSLAEESIFRAAILPHPTEQMPKGRRAVEFAVGQARRAGLTKSDVLNAQPLEFVRAFVARKRNAA